jgi:hypothetical protein
MGLVRLVDFMKTDPEKNLLSFIWVTVVSDSREWNALREDLCEVEDV